MLMWIFAILLTGLLSCCHSYSIQAGSFDGQLTCEENFDVIRVPLTSGFTNILSIEYIVTQTVGIPTVATVANSRDALQYNQLKYPHLLSFLANDLESILMNKQIQRVHKSVSPSQINGSNYLEIVIARLDISMLNYFRNFDRPLQLSPNQSNLKKLKCLEPTHYKIRARKISESNSSIASSLMSSLYKQSCLNGNFNKTTNKCVCYSGYALPNCSAKIERIDKLDQKISSTIKMRENQHYFYEHRAGRGVRSVQIGIDLEGKQSGQFSIDQNKFHILWHIEGVEQPMGIATIFSQQNPIAINRITLRPDERLVITVHKLESDEQYTLKIENVKQKQQQIVLIVGIVTVSVLSLLVMLLFLYFIHCRRFRTGFEARRMEWRQNQVANFVDIEEEFPSIQMKELQNILNSEGRPKQAEVLCGICLDGIQNHGDQMVRYLFCGHIFHSNCIKQWMERQQNCPMCRQSYNPQSLFQWKLKLNIHEGSCKTAQELYKIVHRWRQNKLRGGSAPQNGDADHPSAHHFAQ